MLPMIPYRPTSTVEKSANDTSTSPRPHPIFTRVQQPAPAFSPFYTSTSLNPLVCRIRSRVIISSFSSGLESESL